MCRGFALGEVLVRLGEAVLLKRSDEVEEDAAAPESVCDRFSLFAGCDPSRFEGLLAEEELER